MRVHTWYAFFLLTFLGFVLSGGIITHLFDVFIFVLMLSFFTGFSFAINDCYDVKEDQAKESSENPIVKSNLSLKRAKIFSFSLAVLGVSLSLWFGPIIFVYFLCMTLLSLFYSVPPIRLKSRFPLDILSHGLFFGVLVLYLPTLVFGLITFELLLVSISIFILSVSIELWNHIVDFESDKKARLQTAACVMGLSKSKKAVKFLSLLFPLALLPLFYNGIYLPFFLTFTFAYSLVLLKGIGPVLLYSSEATMLYLYANAHYGIALIFTILGIPV